MAQHYSSIGGQTYPPMPGPYHDTPPPRDSNGAFSPLLKDTSALDLSHSRTTKRKRRSCLPIILLLILIALVLAVILPVYFTIIKPKQGNSHASSNNNDTTTTGPIGGGGNPNSPTGAISGGDGSTIITNDGSRFTYNNKFGGYWVSDPKDPYNNDARPNSWTPPLNQSWTWGKDRIYGVNLGGLFVLEPFITPALFQKYPGAVDEWTLSTLMAADKDGGGLDQLEEHYKTFITEKDIAEIAGAGLNWVRLAIPYWAIETWPGEPFLAKTSWKYILQVFDWCRKYGIRINLDLHTFPGSQNGYNHSGKLGTINFLSGVMGIANAQRALEYIRIIAEFISRPEYKDVVPMFGIMNEALLKVIGKPQLSSFYLDAHNMIRKANGYGAGNGPFISIHEGFQGFKVWEGFLPGSDRIALDIHPYFAFDGSPSLDPIDTGTGSGAGGTWPAAACNRWGPAMNASRSNFGVSIAGEFSAGYNDCGLFLNGIPGTHTYGGDCADWQDASKWSEGTIAGLKQLMLANMDTFGDYFFWTWKIGNSTAGHVEAPLWSYALGLEGGWIPRDPRTAVGTCASYGVSGPVFDGTFQSWQTGGAGAGTIAASATESFPWPPASIVNVQGTPVSLLPTYATTGSVPTLPLPTYPHATVMPASTATSDGSGSAPTPIPGCEYPDPWNSNNVTVPASCGGV